MNNDNNTKTVLLVVQMQYDPARTKDYLIAAEMNQDFAVRDAIVPLPPGVVSTTGFYIVDGDMTFPDDCGNPSLAVTHPVLRW